MSNDLPKIPGPSRAIYTGGDTRQTFKSRRRLGLGGGGSGVGHIGPRRWPRRLLLLMLALLPLVVALAAAGYIYADVKLGDIPRVAVPALTLQQAGQPMDVLIAGSDSRACETSAAAEKAFGSAETQTGQRSDVIIIARFWGDGHLSMFSIPRDTWVPIAGTDGADKINAAFNSGPNQLVATIQDNFHIPINHVIWTTFCGFEGLVNAVGGIHLDFSDLVFDRYTGLDVRHTGCQLVTGTEALALVRSRHLEYYDQAAKTWVSDGMSDWSRIRRQQAFFHALLDSVRGSISDLPKVNALLDAADQGLTVDAGLSSGDIMSLGLHYHSLSTADLTTTVLPTYAQVIEGQDALIPAQPYASQTIARWLAAGAKPTSATSTSGSGSSGPGSTTSVPTTTTPPPSNVITDTPQSLPEPWNPSPC